MNFRQGHPKRSDGRKLGTHKDRTGTSIRFTHHENVEILTNHGNCHAVIAWEGDEIAGYLKYDHTPRTVFLRRAPTIWHLNGATPSVIYDPPEGPLGRWPRGDLHRLIKGIAAHGYDARHDDLGRAWRESDWNWLDQTPKAELIAIIRRAEDSAKGRSATAVRNHTAWRLARPHVAYAATKHIPDQEGRDRSYNGRGIGTLLYRVTAADLAQRGSKGLHASLLQSNDAIGLWASFEQRGWVKRKNQNKWLDGAKADPAQ